MTSETPVSVHEPEGQPKGGVVVVQEAFGVNDHIEDVARRFAAEGWLTVAPHLFHRTGDPKLGYDDISVVAPHMQALTAEGVLADIDAALDHLAARGIPPERIGVVVREGLSGYPARCGPLDAPSRDRVEPGVHIDGGLCVGQSPKKIPEEVQRRRTEYPALATHKRGELLGDRRGRTGSA